MSVSGFIKEVVSQKKKDLAELKTETPMAALRARAEKQKLTSAGFLKALAESSPGNAGIIAEIKKASPSKGIIKAGLDPSLYAEKYTKGGACAISVLTEPHYFKGSLEDLKMVRKSTSLPVLRKDFTISDYQIYEARASGADAVLLIAALLSRDQLKDYISLAREIHMEPLVEIHSEWEIEKTIFANAQVLGVNNRNLETLETDLGVSARIAPYFEKNHIPVEASGISLPEDIEKGMQSGFFNFLVGESIVRAEDTETFIKSLVRAAPLEAGASTPSEPKTAPSEEETTPPEEEIK
ncbi:MAG: indole-3-glycerol phosphate synthase TrpC [Desulfobacteraceae bacterium]